MKIKQLFLLLCLSACFSACGEPTISELRAKANNAPSVCERFEAVGQLLQLANLIVENRHKMSAPDFAVWCKSRGIDEDDVNRAVDMDKNDRERARLLDN
jgi:hypothetical protein